MRSARLVLKLAMLPVAVVLASCAGGGDAGPGGDIAPRPVPPVTQLRGQVIGQPAPVPVTLASGATVSTVDAATLKGLVDAALNFGSSITGNPTCAVTAYTVQYHTIDAAGADTPASTAIMVPSGGAPACQGARPVILYAHGTSVLKATDMARLSASEPRLIAAMFAAQGYIVVAPNYAGYAGSTLNYHPYLDAAQQSADMIDALRAARSVFGAIHTGAGSRLMVMGYSQGGYVALATQRAMQTSYGAEFSVTAAAALSGPYALLRFGDAIFNGAPTMGAAAFLPMLITAAQRAGAGIYASPNEVYEDQYASGIETLLPGAQGLGDLVAAGKLPNDVLFAADSLPQAPGYASFFGADHLIRTSYRDSYLADLRAHPCNTGATALDCAPAQGLRKWLYQNDLRNYTPGVPLFLCGGDADPMVPYFNTKDAAAYFSARGMPAALLTVLDVDDMSLTAPYLTSRAEFAAAKALMYQSALNRTGSAAAAAQAVREAYHVSLVAPFCLREARNYLDSAPSR